MRKPLFGEVHSAMKCDLEITKCWYGKEVEFDVDEEDEEE